eukprot:RCo045090
MSAPGAQPTPEELERQLKRVQEAVLLQTDATPQTPVCRGYDLNSGLDLAALLGSYRTIGFQAAHLGRAVDQVNKMLEWTLNSEPLAEDEDEAFRSPAARELVRCKIFLSYTSNMISAGTREIIRYLAQHSMVQVIVTTAGGVEEDFIKCFANFYMGDFSLPGAELRRSALNRTGNLLVPNSNYCGFENWIMPILDAMHTEQDRDGVRWTPSRVIARLGKEINNPESVYYWCYRNNIPVFCPAITDGSIGDMLYQHSFKRPGLVVDLVEDIRAINNEAVYARKTGVLIVGGGVIKHHVLNANIMRNGADFAVYLNTAGDYDGSDAGANPDEAVSWGKLRIDCKPVKVVADATLTLPLLVALTFAARRTAGKPTGNSDGRAVFNKGWTEAEHSREKAKLQPTGETSVLARMGILP